MNNKAIGDNMSSVSTISWTDVINSFMSAFQNILYEIGQWIVANAGAIATALIGVTIIVAIARKLRGVPLLGGLLGRIF